MYKAQQKTTYGSMLLIDDDDLDQELVREILASCAPKTSLTIANDGQEGVTYLRKAAHEQHCPDVILCDINLPRIDGFEVLEEIQALPEYCDTRVIMWSTTTCQEVEQRCAVLGANEFVVKPFNLNDYRTLLSKILNFKATAI